MYLFLWGDCSEVTWSSMAKMWSHGLSSLLLWHGEKSFNLIRWQYAQLKIRDYITKKRQEWIFGGVHDRVGQEFRDSVSFKAKRYQCFLNSIYLKGNYWIVHDAGYLVSYSFEKCVLAFSALSFTSPKMYARKLDISIPQGFLFTA